MSKAILLKRPQATKNQSIDDQCISSQSMSCHGKRLLESDCQTFVSRCKYLKRPPRCQCKNNEYYSFRRDGDSASTGSEVSPTWQCSSPSQQGMVVPECHIGDESKLYCCSPPVFASYKAPHSINAPTILTADIKKRMIEKIDYRALDSRYKYLEGICWTKAELVCNQYKILLGGVVVQKFLLSTGQCIDKAFRDQILNFYLGEKYTKLSGEDSSECAGWTERVEYMENWFTKRDKFLKYKTRLSQDMDWRVLVSQNICSYFLVRFDLQDWKIRNRTVRNEDRSVNWKAKIPAHFPALRHRC
eukprot:CFRG5813T1